jgi:integrase
MTVRRRGDVWQVDLPASIMGRRIRESHPTKAAAVAREAELRRSPRDAPMPKPYKPRQRLVPTTLRALLSHMWEIRYKASPSARSQWACITHLEKAFGHHTAIRDINRDDIEQYIATEVARGIVPGTINRRLSVLRSALLYADELGWTKAPRIRLVKGQESRLGYLSQDEVHTISQLLFQWGYTAMGKYVTFLAYTGLRPSEGLRVTARDVRDGILTVPISKTGKVRHIPLAREAMEALEGLDGSKGKPLFPFSYVAFQGLWRRVRDHLDRNEDETFIPYILRHSFASWLVQRGTPLQVVSELMGHASIVQTQRYAKLAPINLTAAIASLSAQQVSP